MKQTHLAGNLAITLFVGLAISLPAQAADIAEGKVKAAVCAGCHGINGKAVAPNFPNLAGQKAAYLEHALHSYRDGQRKDPVMQGMAAALSDTDIQNLAAYFSAQAR